MKASRNRPRADVKNGQRRALTLDVPFPAAVLGLRTGADEMAMAEAAHLSATRPRRVTELVAAAYRTIGGQPATRQLVRSLNAAAREWLLYKAAFAFNPALDWFEAPCTHCGKPFDLRLSLIDAPRKGAGEGFPVAQVETSLGLRAFEALNGFHEEAAARAPAGKDLRRVFTGLCGLHPESLREAELFDNDDLAAIEQALEAMAPDLADVAEIACPNCQAMTGARIEPLRHVFPTPQSILREIHLIAFSYHWREAEILPLPPDRRRAYVAMIEADRARATGRR